MVDKITILLLLTLMSCNNKPKMVNTESAYKTSQLGFSQAVIANGFLFTSGQVGWDTNHQLKSSSFESQLKQTMINIDNILNSEGLTINDIISIRYYIKNLDSSKRKQLGKIISNIFKNDYKPTSTLIGVQTLAREELLIEVEIIAKMN